MWCLFLILSYEACQLILEARLRLDRARIGLVDQFISCIYGSPPPEKSDLGDLHQYLEEALYSGTLKLDSLHYLKKAFISCERFESGARLLRVDWWFKSLFLLLILFGVRCSCLPDPLVYEGFMSVILDVCSSIVLHIVLLSGRLYLGGSWLRSSCGEDWVPCVLGLYRVRHLSRSGSMLIPRLNHILDQSRRGGLETKEEIAMLIEDFRVSSDTKDYSRLKKIEGLQTFGEFFGGGFLMILGLTEPFSAVLESL